MSIVYKKGDLFEIAEEEEYKEFALAHCISEDCAMGKGIAVEFKKRFGRVAELKKQVASGKRTGTACVLKTKDRDVYYLITKKVYRNKPTYDSLKSSLEDLRASMTSSGCSGLVIPKIGCGLDLLEWTKVQEILKRVFAKTDIQIVVCSRGTDTPATTHDEKKK